MQPDYAPSEYMDKLRTIAWWQDWLHNWSDIVWCYRQGTADITEEQMRADWLSQRG